MVWLKKRNITNKSPGIDATLQNFFIFLDRLINYACKVGRGNCHLNIDKELLPVHHNPENPGNTSNSGDQ